MPASRLLRRGLGRAGVKDILDAGAAPPPPGQALLLLRADHVYDAALLGKLAKAPGVLLRRPEDNQPVAAHLPAAASAEQRAAIAAALLSGSGEFSGLRSVAPLDLTGAYDEKLRKKRDPYLLRLAPETRAAVEWRMFGGSYKGVTDFVTKYVWPRPAFHVVRLCARLGITPNQVTAFSLLLVFVALWCFWTGQFWTGLAAGWVMTFLDTVDGKLARVTLTSSPFGNLFDHLTDLIHPPFWWLAWIAGCSAVGLPLPHPFWIGVTVFGGYVLQRLQEGLFILVNKMEIHIWRRFDSAFRLFIARRNPNLVMLTIGTAFGRPDLGMLAIAIWTVLGCIEQAVVTLQGMAARRQGPLKSWLDADA